MDEPAKIEAQLAEACENVGVEYALTAFSAAVRWAPAVRYRKVTAYVLAETDAVAEAAGLKEVPSGANVTLLQPYDAGVFHGAEEVGGIMTASPIQVYLDLVGQQARGEEAANAVLRQVIRPSW